MLWALNTTPPPTGRAGGTPWQAEAVQLCTSRDILNYFAMEKECEECATHGPTCDVCHDNYLCEMYLEHLAYQEMHDDNSNDDECY